MTHHFFNLFLKSSYGYELLFELSPSRIGEVPQEEIFRASLLQKSSFYASPKYCHDQATRISSKAALVFQVPPPTVTQCTKPSANPDSHRLPIYQQPGHGSPTAQGRLSKYGLQFFTPSIALSMESKSTSISGCRQSRSTIGRFGDVANLSPFCEGTARK